MNTTIARHTARLSRFLLLAATLSSCTCGQEAPPPPAVMPPTRPPGFQATVAPPPAPTEPAAPEATPTTAVEAEPTPTVAMALPPDFPADIAVMEGSTLASVQKLGGGAHNVLFTLDKDPAQVFEFYKDDLKAKGHEVTQQYQTREQSFLSFKKGDLVTNVVIAKDPNDPSKKVVAIMYYEEQPVEQEF